MGGLFGAGQRPMAAFVERSNAWAGAAVTFDADPDGARAGADGLIAGTRIATDRGWQDVADLRAGDRIVTFDHGLQPVRAVGRGTVTSVAHLPRAARPLHVPPGALGNRRALTLLPGQTVLIESDRAEALYGDPFVLVPAAALEGWNGIARVQPQAETEVVFLEFDGDEIVYAEGMALVHCGRRAPRMVATAEDLMRVGAPLAYVQLPTVQGRALVAAMGT